jgi:hypothetical protein
MMSLHTLTENGQKGISMSVAAQASEFEMVGQPVERSISRTARKLFLLWTAFWWGGVGVLHAREHLAYVLVDTGFVWRH